MLLELSDVNSPSGSAQITVDAKKTLDSVVKWMTDCSPDVQIQIEGHCDEIGTNEYNFFLGQSRSRVVFDYLCAAEVEAKRMEAISYGEELLIEKVPTEAAMSKNRRVHFYELPLKCQ